MKKLKKNNKDKIDQMIKRNLGGMFMIAEKKSKTSEKVKVRNFVKQLEKQKRQQIKCVLINKSEENEKKILNMNLRVKEKKKIEGKNITSLNMKLEM